MAITSMSTTRIGQVTVVTAISNLAPPVYFHWYLDGAYMGMTRAGSFSFALKEDEQARVEAADTSDAAFDPLLAPPAFFPARYTIHWVRSFSADIAEYIVEQRKSGGGWVTILRVPNDPEAWDYQVLTDRLDDIAVYEFRISTVDGAGNVGAAPIGTEDQTVYRLPDAPRWNFTWSAGTQRVTFAAA